MTDPRDLCSVCETPLHPDEGHRCTRCENIVKAHDAVEIVDRMVAAYREHRRLLAIAQTLFGMHEKEPKR